MPGEVRIQMIHLAFILAGLEMEVQAGMNLSGSVTRKEMLREDRILCMAPTLLQGLMEKCMLHGGDLKD